jgi:hypothetical protein
MGWKIQRNKRENYLKMIRRMYQPLLHSLCDFVAQRNGALGPTVRAIIPYICLTAVGIIEKQFHRQFGAHLQTAACPETESVHLYLLTLLGSTVLLRTSVPFRKDTILLHYLPFTYISSLSALVNHSVHFPSISAWAPAIFCLVT